MKNLQLLFDSLKDYLSELEIKERQKYLDGFVRYQNFIDSNKSKGIAKYKIDMDVRRLESRKAYLERDIYFWRLNVKYKLFNSLSKYISDGDVISNIYLMNGTKGLQISCQVVRDGDIYYFVTECISAGGYDVQCFHFRYITKTNLPKNEASKVLVKKFKKMEEEERMEYNRQSRK